eukprot:8942752-Pyramimonas_sp.AAC.1
MLKNPLLQPGRQVALHSRERLLALRERPPVQLVREVPAHPGLPLVGPAVPRLLPVDDACDVLEHTLRRVDSGAQEVSYLAVWVSSGEASDLRSSFMQCSILWWPRRSRLG